MAKAKRRQVKPSAKPSEKPVNQPLIPKFLAKEEFARRLEALRLEKGWIQADLARASGLTRNSIAVYERGDSLPNRGSLRALAEALGVEPDQLLSNYKEGAIARDNPHFELRVGQGDPTKAWLRLNRLVSMALAVKIMALLETEDAQTANRE